MPSNLQVVVLLAASKGYLDSIPVAIAYQFETQIVNHHSKCSRHILNHIEEDGAMTQPIMQQLFAMYYEYYVMNDYEPEHDVIANMLFHEGYDHYDGGDGIVHVDDVSVGHGVFEHTHDWHGNLHVDDGYDLYDVQS
eukprot:TRINITY_DN5301_c0_g1_i9.p2 TRINITY_DN5301_c0_g1~~TRINITY_DN5301_c0_g1_i9.p2  ORF type:complete len:137 (-),score=12.70 TRINITY_DN5301_c0_g1_i9:65-475(-)